MTDQLDDIGRDLAYCWRRTDEIDDETRDLKRSGDFKAKCKTFRLEEESECLDERILVLEQMATQLRATSLSSAMVQVMLAGCQLGHMMYSELNKRDRRIACRAMHKLLYSVLAHLEAEAGVRREDVAGTAYMHRELDPHRRLADVA